MRVHLDNDKAAKNFCKALLEIGEDKLSKDEFGKITLTEQLCLTENSIEKLVEKVFPSIERNFVSKNWLTEIAISAPLNSSVNSTNDKIMDRTPNDGATFTSIDTLMDNGDTKLYPTEFLNSLELPGIPSHSWSSCHTIEKFGCS